MTIREIEQLTRASNPHISSVDISGLKINKDEILGRGSFGTVYKGLYYKLPVAVKVLHNILFDTKAKDDFIKEAQIIS